MVDDEETTFEMSQSKPYWCSIKARIDAPILAKAEYAAVAFVE
jgi:hypothetical protein